MSERLLLLSVRVVECRAVALLVEEVTGNGISVTAKYLRALYLSLKPEQAIPAPLVDALAPSLW